LALFAMHSRIGRTTCACSTTGVGVTVGVADGVTVGVAVGTIDGVALGVTVGVADGVTVGVAVGSGVLVRVGRGVSVGVAVGSGVSVGVAVGSGVTVGVAVGSGVSVGVAVGSGVGVLVAVGSGVLVAVGVRLGRAVAVAVGVDDAGGSGVAAASSGCADGDGVAVPGTPGVAVTVLRARVGCVVVLLVVGDGLLPTSDVTCNDLRVGRGVADGTAICDTAEAEAVWPGCAGAPLLARRGSSCLSVSIFRLAAWSTC